ncbi:LPO_1073/Vpar_1526 family protein [Nitrosomonas communis]|nr:LPO_1073/Vpar_1526 family protein [Nitrosomonas communis]AKH38499.1 hypothetical protein AAW31_12980 [Nitrosomonas communis]
MNQKAQATDGAKVIQVTGNFNQGISFADCERLFNLLMTENFPRLEAIAATKAKENVDALIKSTFEKIESRIDQVSAEKLAQPDVQCTFNTAVQSAAKKGHKIDIDLLAELLEARIEKESSDYIDNCIEAAVEMVPKLTSEMLALLPALHFIQALNYNTPAELDAAFGAIYDRFLSKCVGMTSSKLKTMASIGVGNYINIMGGNTFSEMKKKYLHLQQTDVELNHPRMVEALKFYDQNNLHQLTLTTPGQVIAIKLLAKIFPSISLLACLQ